MSDEWAVMNLGDLLRRVRRPVKVVPGSLYPAVSVTKDGQGLGDKEPFVGGETNYATLYEVRQGDVVLRTITAFESPVGVAQAQHDHSHVSQVFLTYEVRDVVLPAFLGYFFQTPTFWWHMQNRAQGTVLRRKTISHEAFTGIPITLPPLPVQRRITDLMAHLDGHLANLRTEIRMVEINLAALSQHLTQAKPGWREVTVGEVASFAGGYAFPEKHQGESHGEIPFFKVSDMNASADGKHLTSAANWVSRESLTQMKAKPWPRGTVVFPKVGAALMTEKRRILSVEGAFDNNCMGLVPRNEILSDFLFARLSCVRLGEFAQQGAVPSINQSHVASIPISLPTLDEQSEVVQTLNQQHQFLTDLSREIEQLSEFRGACLTNLLFGNEKVSSDYDSLLAGTG